MYDGKNEPEEADIGDDDIEETESSNTMQAKPDIRTLLEESNFVHWEKNFEEEGLELDMLLRMSKEDIKDTLKELKIYKIGERFRLVE